jgi:hypothetical protein
VLANLGGHPALATALVLVGDAGLVAQISLWIALGQRAGPSGGQI